MEDGLPKTWAQYIMGIRRIEKLKAQDNLRMQRAVQMGDGFTRKQDRMQWLREQKIIAGARE